MNGIEAGGSNWSANVSLEVGRNSIMIVVEDVSGELTRKSFSVYRVEPFVFVHMTDVHIGYEPTDVFKTKSFRRSIQKFTDTLQAIKSHNPEFILSPGDMVEWNNEDFFNAYNDILKNLNPPLDNIPVYNTPGNHDSREENPLDDDGLLNYDIYITNPDDIISLNDGFRDYYFDNHGYRFIGLDSGRDYNLSSSYFPPFYDHTPEGDGLKNIQLNNLSEIDSKIPKIIFTHHPINDDNNDTHVFLSTESSINNTCPQYGGNDACIAFNRCEFINYSVHNNVEMILTGHTHKDYESFLFRPTEELVITEPHRFIQTRSATKDPTFLNPDINYHGYRVINITERGITHLSYSTEDTLKKIKTTRYTYWASSYSAPNDTFGLYVTKGELNTGSVPHPPYIIVERNIPDCYYTEQPHGLIICYAKPDKVVAVTKKKQIFGSASFQTMAEEENPFNISIEQQSQNTITTYIWENITLGSRENATAVVELNNTNFTMDIDYDGDGNVDNTTEPTHIMVNNAPIAFIETPFGELKNNVTIHYNLKDNQSNNCTIIAQYSLDNITWLGATINESLINLTTSPTGINHTLTWTVSTDLPNASKNVFFRIKPHDSELGGNYAMTDVFFVGEEEELKIEITPENLQIFPPDTQYTTVTVIPNRTYALTIDNLICKDNSSGCIPLSNPCDEISVVFNDTNNLSTTTNINGKAIIKITLGSSAQTGTMYKYYVNNTLGSTTARTTAIPEFSIILLTLFMYVGLLTKGKRKLI